MRLRYRDIFFLAMIASVCGLVCYAVLAHAAERNNSLRADMAIKQKLIADVDRTAAGAEELQQKIADLQNAVTTFDAHMPSQTESASLLVSLKSMVAEQSLTTADAELLPRHPATGYLEQPIRLTVTGDFDHFYTFLLQLEKSPGQPRVTRLQLEQTAAGAVRAELSLSLFLKPAATVTASLESE